MIRPILAASMAAFALSGCLVPKDTPIGVGAASTFATQYNHRGMVMDDRGVWQPEAQIDIPIRYPVAGADQDGALTIHTWANMGLTDSVGDAWLPDNQGGKFSEVDLTAKYSQSVGPVDLSVGVLAYIFPNGSEFPNGVRGSTTEMFASIGGTLFPDSIFSFTPRVVGHYDADEIDGGYLNFAVAKQIPLIENLVLDLDVSSGYSDDDHSLWTYGVSVDGMADVRGVAILSYTIPDWSNLTFSAGVGLSTIVDDDLRDWFDLIDIETENIWGTFGIGVNF